MSELLNDIVEHVRDKKNNLSEYIKFNLKGKSIIEFITLEGTSLYCIYYPETATLGQLISKLFENYECKNIPNENLILFSDQLKKIICDGKHSTPMSEFGFDKITTIRIRSVNRINKFPTNYEDVRNRAQELHNIYYEEYYKEKAQNLSDNKENYVCKNIQQIFVITLTRKTIRLQTLNSYMIKDIKVLINVTEGIPIEHQILIFEGKHLDDNKTLHDYSIIEYSTLHLVLKLRGGMYHETSGRSGNYAPLKSCIFMI